MVGVTVNPSVADRHRFDAYPDATFHFDADPDPDPPKFYTCWKTEIFLHSFTAVQVYIPNSCYFNTYYYIIIMLVK
jgi:hypothetical protein